MLEEAIGEENFRKATSNFLKKRAFGNADSRDWIEEMQKVYPEQNMTEVVYTWINQGRTPVVIVEDQGDKYVLTQKSGSAFEIDDVPTEYG